MRVERKPLLRRWFTRSGKIDAYDGRSAAKLCSSHARAFGSYTRHLGARTIKKKKKYFALSA